MKKYLLASCIIYCSSALLVANQAVLGASPVFVSSVSKTDLKFWNDFSHVRKNNCYNYSTNRQTDSFAQPGESDGSIYKEMSCKSVAEAAAKDVGLYQVDFFEYKQKKGLTLIALVIADGMDFHWYRRDDNNMWTHKPGQTPATRFDNSGELIADPEIADRGRYRNFCGYFAIENYPTTEHEQNAGFVRIGNMENLPNPQEEVAANDRNNRDDDRDDNISYVEFLIYSGRKNPRVPLKDFLQDKKLEKQLLSFGEQTPLKRQKINSSLGYNGILIHDQKGLIFDKKLIYLKSLSGNSASTALPKLDERPEDAIENLEQKLERKLLSKAAELGLKDILSQSGALD